jgi:cold shock CspA family protein
MSTIEQVSQPQRLLGQVKWFNNKAGYGFITVSDGEQAGKDIFTHFSSIGVSNTQQYKYLVQGEYVEFVLGKSTVEGHEFQAIEVSGVKNGKLMCETRFANRPAPTEGNVGYRKYRVPRDERPASPNTPPPNDGEFTRVQRKRPVRGGARPPRAEKPVQGATA